MHNQLIIVDENDNEIGYGEKLDCHTHKVNLHRAFSIFIFNNRKELLIQQRSSNKLLWPFYWSNTVCSHPLKGEMLLDAAHRRLQEEVGLSNKLIYLFKFQYFAEYLNIGSEFELCSVFIGKQNGQITIDPNEISDYKYVSLDFLQADMLENPDMYTPWFKIELQRVITHYMREVSAL
jgi:isopentenyl-diphosphate delta-isomerase